MNIQEGVAHKATPFLRPNLWALDQKLVFRDALKFIQYFVTFPVPSP
jgi:hypothetical protein